MTHSIYGMDHDHPGRGSGGVVRAPYETDYLQRAFFDTADVGTWARDAGAEIGFSPAASGGRVEDADAEILVRR